MKRIKREVAGDAGGDEVQHDRVDHLMTAAPGTEPTWNEAPQSAARNTNQHPDGGGKKGRASRPRCSDNRRCDCARNQLTFAADVKKSCMECQCDGQSRKDERRGVEQSQSE